MVTEKSSQEDRARRARKNAAYLRQMAQRQRELADEFDAQAERMEARAVPFVVFESMLDTEDTPPL